MRSGEIWLLLTSLSALKIPSQHLRRGCERHDKPQRFELFHVATERALLLTLVEIVGAEFLMGDAVAQDVIRDFEDLVADRHEGALVPALPFDPIVASSQRRLFGMGRGPGNAVRSARLPFRVLPRRRLPALSSWPGHIPAQLQRWAALGNRDMSPVVSAMRIAAVVRATPGIVIRFAIAGSKGAKCRSISAVSRSSASSR